MPNMNGLELYKRLRQSDESIKVLILTASQEKLFNSHNNELQDAVLKIVGKPILIPKLLSEIDSQNMSTPETNMTGGTNATMGGNMTSGNATSDNMAGPTNMTSSP